MPTGKRRKRKQRKLHRHLDRSGELCLALVNTAVVRKDNRYRRSEPPSKPAMLLDSYADLVLWGRRMDVLEPEDARRLEQLAAEPSGKAEEVLARALALRQDLTAIFTAVAVKRTLPAPAVARLNAELEALPPRIVVVDDEIRRDWAEREDDLDRMLWPTVRSAAELLASDDRGAVRLCANPDCSWIFVDRRSRRRVWCDDVICGSRHRGRRHNRIHGQRVR